MLTSEAQRVDESYFDSYSYFDIHREMLGDKVHHPSIPGKCNPDATPPILHEDQARLPCYHSVTFYWALRGLALRKLESQSPAS